MIKVFGIRHHGPGSSRALQKALERMQPDCILIESPEDAESVYKYAGDEQLKPPVAILIYNPKDLQQAAYLPFASFSPEWISMQFGLKNEVPVHFMDLPMHFQFAWKNEAPSSNLFQYQPEETGISATLAADPMGYMARLAGYEDTERWWETTFESPDNPDEIFDAISEMTTAMREAAKDQTTETILREAYMRKIIRKKIKDGYQNIAVVCGAWHVPAILKYDSIPATKDNALLKGMKKEKTQSTWISWSYERLTFESGYGAGIQAPAWYELLFKKREKAVLTWMAKAARLLRSEDLEASTASVVEAVRLAESLAAIRGLSIAGIFEMKEAASTVFSQGSKETIDWIERELIIGKKYGKIPDSIPVLPLQQDLEKSIKTARLSKDWESNEVVEKKLDLRKDTNLIASQLLHRLNILGIPWGKLLEGPEKATGSFGEYWILDWQPDFALGIIEAGMWGTTVPEACCGKIMDKVRKENLRLPEMTDLLVKALIADLSEIISALLQNVKTSAAITNDALHLMQALPYLVQTLRYGSVRKTDQEAVLVVVEEMVPRMTIGLPGLCVGIDEDEAREISKFLLQANHAIGILQEDKLDNYWWESIRQIAINNNAVPLLKGMAQRLLLDKGLATVENSAIQMSYALSFGVPYKESAEWLAGFLHGSGLLLIHQPGLWKIVDQWIEQLEEARFEELLPLLRRTFSSFSGAERKMMLDLVKKPPLKEKAFQLNDSQDEQEELEIIIPMLKRLLNV
jgi:hypothetical protein